ncbi:hypothetical protein PHMEG_00018714 [Phytophthora megakarya]|uniref:Uncharacterized protein n=1 Tax=Phytophthora megakarya TaxID=4795 RepID=A0A225VVZ1_9STRA|nr:hypothetical protein PHMEG_00018714 [Phytophthora megakarya]
MTRRNRDLTTTTNNCLEVQWRFMHHKNPKPPQYSSPPRKPLLIDPLTPQNVHNNNTNTLSKQVDYTRTASRGSPSRLFQMFEKQEIEQEPPNLANSCQPSTQQERCIPESPRASRTLNDLMGETQRQAMLDRILADMEFLAVEPTYSRLGQPDNKGSSKIARSYKPSILRNALQSEPELPKALYDQNNDRKRRQHRKLQQVNQENEGPRIFWQHTTGAKSAADVPRRLLTLSPPPSRRKSAHIVLGRRSNTRRKLLMSSLDHLTSAIHLQDIPETTSGSNPRNPSTSSRHQRRNHRHVSTSSSSPSRHSKETGPVSPLKAHYGAWYVPQSEWWTLHQIEQQHLTNKFPLVTLTTADEDGYHCHRSNTTQSQRQHKPILPSAALSPRLNEKIQSSKPALQNINGSSRATSASSCTGATQPSSPSLEVQVAGIPQSYIGREYRAYIVSTGSTMPQYLQ